MMMTGCFCSLSDAPLDNSFEIALSSLSVVGADVVLDGLDSDGAVVAVGR